MINNDIKHVQVHYLYQSGGIAMTDTQKDILAIGYNITVIIVCIGAIVYMLKNK